MARGNGCLTTTPVSTHRLESILSSGHPGLSHRHYTPMLFWTTLMDVFETVMGLRTIKTFANQKPWMNTEMQLVHHVWDAAFRSGDQDD